MQPSPSHPRLHQSVLVLTFLLSLWLRMAFPINAIADAGHDDLLFVRQAFSIGSGHWLGTYDNLTHAKGIGFSLFMLFNHVLGLPLKLSEHVCYLAVALLFAAAMGRLYRSRLATITIFALLAFIPVVWSEGVGGRVVRENIYVTLSLLMLALGVRCWTMPGASGSIESPAIQLRNKWPSLVLLGLVAGLFWITREEGVWMLPAMVILGAHWLWRHRRLLRAWKPSAAFLLLPVLAASLVIGAVNVANYKRYGVFRNNDFRSSDFQAGYGSLTRIRHNAWQRYVLFPRDARERAYAMSPAARELQPFFEGAGGERWRGAGCNQTGTASCPEILSGWFMWALRDAVAEAGHYRDAREAQSFYRRLAAEIDAGCRQQPDECLPARETLTPPWQNSYLVDTLQAARAVFDTLRSLGGWHVSIGQSSGAPERLALFAAATNGALAPVAAGAPGAAAYGSRVVSPRDVKRVALAQWFAKVESNFLTLALPLAMVLWLLWFVAALIRREVGAPLVVATALAAAVATRVLLLAFLEATSIPSNNMLYLFPVAPMALALVPVVLWGCLRFVRPHRGQQQDRVSA